MTEDQTDKFLAKYVDSDSKIIKRYDNVQTALMVGVIVRDLRESMNMNQAEFAKLVGKSKSMIVKIEAGEVDLTVSTLQNIASATNHKLKIEFV